MPFETHKHRLLYFPLHISYILARIFIYWLDERELFRRVYNDLRGSRFYIFEKVSTLHFLFSFDKL